MLVELTPLLAETATRASRLHITVDAFDLLVGEARCGRKHRCACTVSLPLTSR